MSSVRIGSIACVVIFCLISAGCSVSNTASPNPSAGSTTPLPSSVDSSGNTSSVGKNAFSKPAWLLHGPYDPLLRMTADQVREVLGDPGKTSEEGGGQQYWEYPNLGLEITLFKDKVFFFNQTQGKITESLGVGDPEDKAVAVAGELEPSSMDPGAKVGRMYPPELDIKIWVVNGRVVEAQVMRPGRDN